MGNLQIPNWGHLQMPPHQPTWKAVERPPKNLRRLLKGLEGLQGPLARRCAWPSVKIPLAAAAKKTRRGTQLRTSNAHCGLGSCPNWTNKGLIDAPSQDASVESNEASKTDTSRKDMSAGSGQLQGANKGGVRRREKGVCVCVCVCVVVVEFHDYRKNTGHYKGANPDAMSEKKSMAFFHLAAM